ncbi:MAG: hypothetical protein C0619_14070 [Desulfuromonas sp.]|nr:MAG: hypothetical protein C0619_14070 [Desulfuromonas sp.]
MIKLVRWLVWLLVSLIVLSLLDQALIRVPMQVPVLTQFQEFYIDFRGRLLGLVDGGSETPSIDKMIDRSKEMGRTDKPSPGAAPRYLYVDDSGALQFADSLEAVPPQFRKDAQPMEQ